MNSKTSTILMLVIALGFHASCANPVQDPPVVEKNPYETKIRFIHNASSPLVEIMKNGTDYIGLGQDDKIYHSSDAIDWVPTHNASGGLCALAFGDGVYVALSTTSGQCYVSSDGLSWVATTALAPFMYGLAFGNGTFVAVGSQGKIFSSPDGLAWNGPYVAGTTEAFSEAEFVNGMFVATGRLGVTSTSMDGTTWTTAQQLMTINGMLSVSYAFGKYYLAGESAVIFSSADASTWSGSYWPSYAIHELCFGFDRLLAVGQEGDLLVSLDGASWNSLGWTHHVNFWDAIWDGNEFLVSF